MNFQDKRVIIGGSSGIGLATTAITAGAKVLIADRSIQKLEHKLKQNLEVT